MSDRPWYKRYGADFVLSTMSLSLEEKGAFSICIDMIYDRRGPIPDDARWLAGLCGISVRKWGMIREALIAAGKIYVTDDGDLMNYRAHKSLENPTKTARKVDENPAKTPDKSEIIGVDSKKNSKLPAPRARARAHTRTRLPEARSQNIPLPNGSGPALGDDEPLGDPPRPKPKNDPPPPPAPSKGTRLKAGWKPTDEQIQWALDLAAEIGISCDRGWVLWIAGRYHDYWVAQPGQRGVRLDWDAVWRNWVRREFEEGNGRNGPRAGNRSGAAGRRDERDHLVGDMLQGAAKAVDGRR